MDKAKSQTTKTKKSLRVKRVVNFCPNGWFPKDEKPKKVGVYHTSYIRCYKLGGAYGYWNGRNWEAYKRWGDYRKAEGFLWHGIGRGLRNPCKIEGVLARE
jgi:hypothetical protein